MAKEHGITYHLAALLAIVSGIAGCSVPTPDFGSICYLCDTSFSFGLHANTLSHTIEQGDVATSSIWMKKTGGSTTHNILLSVRNCPQSVRCVLADSIIGENDATNLHIYTTASTPVGKWNIVVDGVDTGSSGASNSLSIGLTVVQSTLQLNFTHTAIAVGAEPVAIASADFNSDSIADIAVVNSGANEVVVLFGDGTGAFPTRRQLATGTTPVSVVAQDINSDGVMDIVAANAGDETLSIYFGNGDGSFWSGSNIDVGAPGGTCESVLAGDFNGDGAPDLVSINHISGTDVVSTLFNDGFGNFGNPNNLLAGIYPSLLTLGDLNDDGALDIAFSDIAFFYNNVSVFYGDGLGGFGSLSTLQLSTHPGSMQVGDLNGDGKSDLVASDRHTMLQSAYLKDDAGLFKMNLNTQEFINPVSLVLRDINADSKVDMIGVNYSLESVTVRAGDGVGGFAKFKSFAAGTTPGSFTTGDFNGDGKVDIVITNQTVDKITVLLQQ